VVARWWNGQHGEDEQDIWLYSDGPAWYVTIRDGGPGHELYRLPCGSEKVGRKMALEIRANSYVGLTSWVDITPKHMSLSLDAAMAYRGAA
jgi:hypothetical protein